MVDGGDDGGGHNILQQVEGPLPPREAGLAAKLWGGADVGKHGGEGGGAGCSSPTEVR